MVTDIESNELDAKLKRIEAYEGRFRTTPMTHLLRWAGRTRAFAAAYRRIGPPIDRWLTRWTHGEVARVYGIPALLLTTTGARTGKPRVVPLLYVRHGRQFAVVGSNFGRPQHPAWTANLLAHSDASIEVGPEQMSVTAELADEAARSEVWPKFRAIYPGIDGYAARCAPRVPRVFLLRPTA